MPFATAISGIRSASSELDVVGNNIANASTSGFKLSRTEFADVYAATNQGVAANQTGSGSRVSRVAQQFTQGNITFTDNPLDIAINGQGMFVLDDNGERLYTRAGAFGVDRGGFIVNAGNQRLVGYQADSTGTITGQVGSLSVNTAAIAPVASTTLTLNINLDAAATVPTAAFAPADSTSFNNSTSTTIYDSLGNSHLATLYYRKSAANTWDSYLYVDNALVDGPDSLTFNGNGTLTAPAGGTVVSPSFTPSGGGSAQTLTLDYGTSTQYGGPFSVNSLVQDGYATGRLTGLEIDPQGTLFARFTNGQSNVLGQIALANFANVQGLQPQGDTNWSETFASGSPLVGAPGSASLGLLQSGALEDSNVDISEQLVKMIVAQRNFQANAQVISTADAVTQSIINIR